MAVPVETEIKLEAQPAVLKALRAHPALAGEDRHAILVTTYFDTIGGRLRRSGATLRLRQDGRTFEQTLKLDCSSGSGIRRSEWSVPTASERPDGDAFPESARAMLARLLDGGMLEPVAISRIERTARHVHFGASAIEAAFDTGAVLAGRRKAPVCELELELADGRLADLLRLAAELPLGPGLHWSLRSKAQRCHDLAFDLAPAAVRAQPLDLATGMTVARGFQAIAWNCLAHLLANYPLVASTGDPEAVHQARVAIRRLRAAFGLFGDIASDKALPVLRAELKAVANTLGPARDLHVLIQQVASSDRLGAARTRELLAHLEALQVRALQSAQAMLETAEFQRLLFDMALWIESGEWLSATGDTGGDGPLAGFAAELLARRRRKLRKSSAGLLQMPETQRHRLRIEAKKLRYATEFFASLFRDTTAAGHRKPFNRALSRLQDSLGELNDLAVASAGQQTWFESLEPITAARLATELAELLDARHKSRRKLLNKAEAALREIAGCPAWWKGGSVSSPAGPRRNRA